MFSILDDDAKVLLQIGEWELHATSRDPWLKSYPVHLPCEIGCNTTSKPGHHVPKCANCNEPVPEGIEAMYIFHNWELRNSNV